MELLLRVIFKLNDIGDFAQLLFVVHVNNWFVYFLRRSNVANYVVLNYYARTIYYNNYNFINQSFNQKLNRSLNTCIYFFICFVIVKK